MQRQMAINAGAIDFTKDDATVLYLESHAKAETAAEEIRAVDSLVKLHGLATPERVEVNITRRDQLEEMDDKELLKMTGQDIQLSPADYAEVQE
jgi:rRNA maturation endonuclease Nob1